MTYWTQHARGQQGEKFVKDDLKRLHPEALLVDLAPSFPCDLLMLEPFHDDYHAWYVATWIEVKVLSKGLPKLTPPETEFLAARRAAGDMTKFYHLKPNGDSFIIRSIV